MNIFSNFFIMLKASRKLGKSFRLYNSENFEMSYEIAKSGLDLFSNPKASRRGTGSCVVLAELTFLLDELAYKLNKEFPNENDYVDSYVCIKVLEETPNYKKYEKWLLSIEKRLGYIPS